MRVLLSVMLVIVGPAMSSAQGLAGSAADQQAIRRLLEECSAAFNEAQAAKVIQLFTPGADVRTNDGRLIQRADLERWLAGEFDGPVGPRTVQVSMTGVRFLTPDLALLDGLWIERTPGPHGRETPPVRMRVVAVVVRKDGRWLFEAFRRYETPR